MSVIHTPSKPALDLRVLFFPVVCGAMLVVLFLRLWYFQIVLGPVLSEKSTRSEKILPTLAPRGLIVDRGGKLVAGIRPQLVVTGVRSILDKHPEVLTKVAKILDVPEAQLKRKLLKGPDKVLPTPIFVGASIEIGSRIAEAGDYLPGIGIESQPMRYYPDPSDFGHVLGNVWVPDEKDVKRFTEEGEDLPKYVGKFGVEWFYEKLLMGTPGSESMEMDAKHHPVRVVGREKPTLGSRLVLTIDGTLQKIAVDRLQGQLGAVVAIEPSTGEVLAMVSSPTLDLKKFEGGISSDDYRALIENEDKPYLNRASSGVYAPGSTFKIVTSLAAYETGKFDPSRRIYCDGGYHFPDGPTIRCLSHHGSIPYKTAFEKSCNTYFCTLGMDVGEEALQKAAHELGLGDSTGIDIRGDSSGVIPSREWKTEKKKGKWFGGDTANMAIGQGYVLTTPLQMADLAATVANRGVLYQPHLVRATRDPYSSSLTMIEPKVLSRINVSPEFWSTLIDAMVGVVSEGTGGLARLPDLEWAGKTGSAEHGAQKTTHAWFVGFAPAENPKIAICVLLESAGHGGDVAAPIARDIVKAYLEEVKTSANRPSASNKVLPADKAPADSTVLPKSR
jgi:penicillin-binding protein 2